MGKKLILIDMRKREEAKALKQLCPKLLQDMDRWVVRCQDTTPTEAECKKLEDAQIEHLLQEFDAAAAKLERVRDQVPSERDQIVRMLGWKRGKLFLKFSNAIGALKQQAADSLQQCQEMYKAFEKEQLASFPVSEDELRGDIVKFLQSVTQYVEDTYPDGVKGLEGYDTELPANVMSYSEFQAMVAAKEAELKEANQKAIPAAVQQLKDMSQKHFKTLINEAITKTVDEIVADISDDTLPYLAESEMTALRSELIDAAKAYGASRLDG